MFWTVVKSMVGMRVYLRDWELWMKKNARVPFRKKNKQCAAQESDDPTFAEASQQLLLLSVRWVSQQQREKRRQGVTKMMQWHA